MTKSIAEIKTILTENPQQLTPEEWNLLKADSRKGVQKLLQQYEKSQAQKAQLEASFQSRLQIEKELKEKGYHYIAGIDEVGRGPLAGPVVACSVILKDDFHLLEVNDSKQLNEAKREMLAEKIKEQAVAVGIGIVNEAQIDELNIYQATKKAMLQAVANLKVQPDFLILDAMKLETKIPQASFIKGDARSISIAAASIVAKVTRDHLMKEYHEKYPGYGFDHNAGYGTKEHLLGLEKFGPTPIHRKTFAPVKKYL